MRVPVLVLPVLLSTAFAFAQKKYVSPDDAWITDPSVLKYLQAHAFQHGQFHGYEDGFEAGDVDFHLQRPEPDFKKVKEYRSATRGYEDGDKEQYRTGYQDGFLIGYGDAQAGRPFAGFERLQAAAEDRAVEVASDDQAVSDDQADKLELATLKAPIQIPFAAVFPSNPRVEPPGPSRETILARIMNNLRRTFMPTSQAAAGAPAAAFTGQGVGPGTPR